MRRPRRGRRSPVALACLGLLLAACGSDTAEEANAGPADAPAVSSADDAPTTSPGPAPTAVPACPEAGVRVTVGPEDAAMGLRLMGLELTDCGTEPTTVSGYPEPTLLDDDRRPLAVQVLHGPEPITSNEGYCTPTGLFDAGPQPVTLRPGERARAGIVWRNLTTDELHLLINAPHLTVAPSPADAPQELALSGPIDLGTTGRLGVSAWAPDGPSSCP